MPIGLYAIERPTDLHVADLVIVRPPEQLESFLADRNYLPRGVPLVKHVLALAGQSVCRSGVVITIDTVAVADARERDSQGGPLPSWQGCRIIRENEVFLLNSQSSDLLDGRYFGVLPVSSIVGRAPSLDPQAVGEELILSFLRKTTGTCLLWSRVSLSSFAVGSCAATSQHGGASMSLDRPRRRVFAGRRAPPFALAIDRPCDRSRRRSVQHGASGHRVRKQRTPNKLIDAFSFYSVHRRGVAKIRNSLELDTRGNLDRKRRPSVCGLAEGRDGPHADHAQDLCRIAHPLSSRTESRRPAGQHSRWRRLPARNARPLRFAWPPGCLQCRPGSVSTPLGEGRTAPARNPGLCRDAHADDRGPTSREPAGRSLQSFCLASIGVVRSTREHGAESRPSALQIAARSAAKRPSCCRSLSARAAVGWVVRAPSRADWLAMREIVLCRVLSRVLAPPAKSFRRTEDSGHGLQDKSADCGRAHMVGLD